MGNATPQEILGSYYQGTMMVNRLFVRPLFPGGWGGTGGVLTP